MYIKRQDFNRQKKVPGQWEEGNEALEADGERKQKRSERMTGWGVMIVFGCPGGWVRALKSSVFNCLKEERNKTLMVALRRKMQRPPMIRYTGRRDVVLLLWSFFIFIFY